jgi:hypothetical protein
MQNQLIVLSRQGKLFYKTTIILTEYSGIQTKDTLEVDSEDHFTTVKTICIVCSRFILNKYTENNIDLVSINPFFDRLKLSRDKTRDFLRYGGESNECEHRDSRFYK